MKTINVNKEVKISNEYIKSSSRDSCINIYDENETGGFTQFVICFDMVAQCCEDYDINILNDDGTEVKDWNGTIKNLERIEVYAEPTKAIVDTIKNDWLIDIDEVISTRLYFDDTTWTVTVYNVHNGYYSHDLYMEYKEDGTINFEIDSAL